MPRIVHSITRITESWKAPAALDAYLKRINADVRNFRCYVVKREGRDHYHYDACVIRVIDGKLDCPDKAFAPTEEEAKAIEFEITHQIENNLWPKHIAARNTDNLKAMLGVDSELYEYLNPEGEVIFVQNRVRHDDGTKNDFPWSFWNDGHWRQMEPDGHMPLYGQEKLKNAAVVFVHEGAKCAASMTKEFLAHHPWKEDLLGMGVVHIGWPAGAPNPHRVDWEPLRSLSRHKRIILVADNDISGNEAIPKISRAIQRSCETLSFGINFPQHFDLADAWPKGLEVKFEECINGATWATRRVKIGEKEVVELREEFIAESNYTVKPPFFIHRTKPDVAYAKEEFNGKFRRFSDVANLAGLLQKSFHAQCEGLAYEPCQPTGRIVLKDQGLMWNAYQPCKVKPIKGDVTMMLEFMEHLLPIEEDRRNAMRWIATLIARPDIKMKYGMLLVSEEQGVGKDTLGSAIIAPLLGHHNVSHPNEEMVTEKFNGWLMNKRLAIVSEIYQGHSSKCYNKLKEIVTDQKLEIRLMNTNTFAINNHCHLLAFSNSMRALKIDASDRRWFVPTVREDKRNKAYWKKLYAWCADHLPQMMDWAHTFVKDEEKNVVDNGELPPMSSRKLEVIRDAMSPGEVLAADLATALARKKEQVVLRLDLTRIWIGDRKQALDPTRYKDNDRLESAQKIASIFRHHGCKISNNRMQIKDVPKFVVAANFDIDNSTVWSHIERIEKKPQEVYSWTDEGRIFG